jgi:hypothetical protein
MKNAYSKISLVMSLALAAAIAGAQAYVGPQIRIDPGRGTFAANETSIASVGAFGLDIAGSWNDWSASQGSTEIIRCGIALSSDGGQTWIDDVLRPPSAQRTNVEGDPYTIYDARTGNVWVGAIAFGGNGSVYIARKRQGSNTFDPAVNVQVSGSADKVWGAAGPLPGNPDSTRLYVSYNLGTARSDNLGSSWLAPVNHGSGLGFLPRVSPNGTLHLSYWNGSSGMIYRRSLNGGSSFEAQQTVATRIGVWSTSDCPFIPGNFRVPPIQTMAVDPIDGTVYYVYSDLGDTVGSNRNVDTYFMKSTNDGATWSSPVRIFTRPGFSRDHFFPWIEVDRAGRIHMVYYSTEAEQQNDNATSRCIMDAYYGWSDDGGSTWFNTRLTPRSFDGMDDGLARSMAFYGDYLGLAFAGARAYPHYVSSQNGDPDNFTHVVSNPNLVPETVRVTHGAFVSGNADSTTRSDDNRYVVQARPRLVVSDPEIGIELGFVAGQNVAAGISGSVELSSSGTPSSNVRQFVEIFNRLTQVWDVLDERSPTSSDSTVTFNIANGQNYVAPNRELTMRVRWFDRGVIAPNWVGRVDAVRLRVLQP